MAFWKKKSQTLTLAFLLSTLAALTVAQESGDIHTILRRYGMPPGIFPSAATNASVGSNGELTVDLSQNCYIPFPFRGFLYSTMVTGLISVGKIENIVGIGVQIEQPPWIPVRMIKVVRDDWPYGILFDTGEPDSTMTISANAFNEVSGCYNLDPAAALRLLN